MCYGATPELGMIAAEVGKGDYITQSAACRFCRNRADRSSEQNRCLLIILDKSIRREKMPPIAIDDTTYHFPINLICLPAAANQN